MQMAYGKMLLPCHSTLTQLSNLTISNNQVNAKRDAINVENLLC